LKELIKTDCGVCSPKQKEGSRKVIEYMEKKKKKEFEELLAIYDPTGEYYKEFKKNHPDQI
jgi:hypothetical protein